METFFKPSKVGSGLLTMWLTWRYNSVIYYFLGSSSNGVTNLAISYSYFARLIYTTYIEYKH